MNPSRLLIRAAQRVEIPALPVRIDYDADVDTLYLRFKEGGRPTHSEDDAEKGIVYGGARNSSASISMRHRRLAIERFAFRLPPLCNLARKAMKTEVDYVQLQQRYGGCFVARRDGGIITSAETYDELSEQLEEGAVEWDDLIIEYVEPGDVVSVY